MYLFSLHPLDVLLAYHTKSPFRVTSCYSPQQKYTLPGRRGTSTESCNSMTFCAGNALDRITYMLPFFSMSGSEFVEVLVGVGASRVRVTCRRLSQDASL
jgi:hypothetical protein